MAINPDKIAEFIDSERQQKEYIIKTDEDEDGLDDQNLRKYDPTIDERLPETVTLLTTPDGGKLYLVGTVHFSTESQNDVSTIIQAVQPHIVVVELCRARLGILQLDEETLQRYTKNISYREIFFLFLPFGAKDCATRIEFQVFAEQPCTDMRPELMHVEEHREAQAWDPNDTIKKEGFYNGLLYILLLRMASHIAEQLGMPPGGEFRRAFEEAKKIPNCIVHMADRPINITIQRAIRFLSWWQTIKLAWHLTMMKEPITQEDIELCKQRSLLDEIITGMKKDFPVLGQVFVKERDIYLTYSLQLACFPLRTIRGDSPARVVGIVGLGHMSGIIENWGKVQSSDIQSIITVPPPPLSSKILKLTIKSSLLGAIAYVGYKVMSRPITITFQCIKSSVEGLLKTTVTR